MHACGYETVSTRICSGAIVLSRLGIPPGRHALDIEAVGLVIGQLDWLPSRGECKKVIHCDTCTGRFKKLMIEIYESRSNLWFVKKCIMSCS